MSFKAFFEECASPSTVCTPASTSFLMSDAATPCSCAGEGEGGSGGARGTDALESGKLLWGASNEARRRSRARRGLVGKVAAAYLERL